MKCAKCPATISKSSKSGLCLVCSHAHLRKERKCTRCGNAVTKYSTSGLCRGCYDGGKATEALRVSGNSGELTRVVPERVRTLTDLIRVCEIDTTEWEVERFVCNKWEQASMPRPTGTSGQWKRESTTPLVTPLFQVKAWLKRKVALVAAREEIAALLASAKERIVVARPHVAPVRHYRRHSDSPYMLELSIPDLHFGKLGWSAETGYANYDTKIAQRIFQEAVFHLVERTSSYAFREIVFVVGNDLLNADNKANTTTRGTPQDTDSRFQKTFGYVRRMMTDTIVQLSHLAPVIVPVVPGNHDAQAAWHLGDSLECFFHNRADVTINNAPTMRKYRQHGRVMLMWTHGDKGKRADYPLLMATEQPEMFGATLFREAHTGHLHHERVNEFHGVKVRISPALCAADAWHSENHHVGAQRSAEAFIWHADEGLVGTAVYTVSPTKE